MLINDLYTNKKPNLSEGMAGKVVFSGTGADGGTYEIIQSGDGFMIHANGRHIDTYGSLQRAMSVLQNEVPGLLQGMAEGSLNEFAITPNDRSDGKQAGRWLITYMTKDGTTKEKIMVGKNANAVSKYFEFKYRRKPLSVVPYIDDMDLRGSLGLDEQGVAEARTDYQKRRQRERDVDAGKPVKPEPRNPQNDYFARRKKEKDLAEGWRDIYNLNKQKIGNNPNLIKPGTILTMPGGSPYKVKSGDNLSSIAKTLSVKPTQLSKPPVAAAPVATNVAAKPPPEYDPELDKSLKLYQQKRDADKYEKLQQAADAEQARRDMEAATIDAFDNPIEPGPDLTRDERQQQMLTTPNLRGPIKITGPNGEQFQFDTPAEANYFRDNMRELYQQDQEREGTDSARANFVIQAESTSAKKKGMAEDDDAVAAFMARGGEIQRLKSAKPRKGERWQGSAHIGAAGGRGTKGRVSGLGANTGKSGKPVVTAEQGNPVAGQNFTMKDGAQMKWNPTTNSWQQQAPVPGDDGGFNVVSVRDTGHTIDNGDTSTDTFTSTGIFKNPTTGEEQTVADWDHTDPKTGINYIGTNYIDSKGNVRTEKNYEESKKTKVDEVSLGDYRKKATVNKAMAQTNKFFGRDDPAAVAAADRTIAKRERGLGRADARRQPYTAPPVDQDKQRRDLADKYPNIDELVRRAELNRDPQYDRADGQAYYDGRDAEQNYHKLKQIQRMIRGAELDEMDLGGVSQTTDSDTGDVTTNFSQGPLSVSQTKTPGGYTKQTDQQFNLGTATLGARTVGPNIGAGQLAGTTTKTATNTATGQAKQQIKGVGFGGASGATVGKNYVGSSDDELAKYAADSVTGINEEPGQVTVDVPGSSFTANKSTNTLSGTTNVHGVNMNATKDMTPGGATTFSANMNVAPNLNIAATQKSADYNKGQLAGTKSVAAKYTDTTGALGKPGQQHTATRTAGVGFGGATGANVGKNYVDQYSVNESMDRLRHLAGIKQSRV